MGGLNCTNIDIQADTICVHGDETKAVEFVKELRKKCFGARKYYSTKSLVLTMRTAIFKVIKPGLLTTVQDLGRYGYQQFGISPSGAMDPYSMQLANILVGNDQGEAVLEASFLGPVLEAGSDMVIAICGGQFSTKVDGREVLMWKSFLLKKGEILSMGSYKQGARAYLAIAGGIGCSCCFKKQIYFFKWRLWGLKAVHYKNLIFYTGIR